MTRMPTATNDDGEAARFPTEVFHPQIIELISELCEKKLYQPDHVGTALLSAFAAAIGSSYNVRIDHTHVEPSILWAVIVAPPGMRKTPLLNLLYNAFQQYDLERQEAHKLAKEEKKFYPIKFNTFPLEAVIEAQDINPKGTICHVDEITSLTGNFNRYHNGDDESYLLRMFSGDGLSWVLKTKPTIITESSCVNIVGSTQPNKLRNFVTESRLDSGFIYRFIFACPECVVPMPSDIDINPAIIDRYEALIMKMLKTEAKLKTLTYTPEARAEIHEWKCRNVQRMNDLIEENNDDLAGLLSKRESLLYRFSLIIHVVNCSATGNDIPEWIELPAVISAEALLDYYYQQTLTAIGYSERPLGLKHLKPWEVKLFKALPHNFTRSEAIAKARELKLGKSESSINRLLADRRCFSTNRKGDYAKAVKA